MTDATRTRGTRLPRLSLLMRRYISASLIGPFEASLDERPLYKFRTNKVQALLIYLATESSVVHRRDGLMALLWPGLPQKSAQVNLRQTLCRLRQTIPEVMTKDREGTVPFPLVDAGGLREAERAVALHASAATLPREVAEAAQARGRALDWWEAAQELLAELRQVR